MVCFKLVTFLVPRLEYSLRMRSTLWLLMSWLLASPGHQMPWYWYIRWVHRCFSWRRIISNTSAISVSRSDRKYKYIFMFPEINFVKPSSVEVKQHIKKNLLLALANVTEVCFCGSHWQDISIGPGNGLTLKSYKPLPLPVMTKFNNSYKFIFCFQWNLNQNIAMKFVPVDPIDNISALVQVMCWRWTGYKPLPEPMMTKFYNNYKLVFLF